MNTIRLIGDVHGKWKQYRDITRDIPYSLQIGDFGFKMEHERHLEHRDSECHKICFGNHDDYTFLNAAHSMGNFGTFKGIFCIRGAFSIDYAYRLARQSWWSNEQLTYSEMMEALDAYEQAKPDILVTHDCPKFIYDSLGYTPYTGNRTSSFLSHLFEIHKPKQWFFGHHHVSRMWNIQGCEFRCLNELEYVDIEI